MKPGGCEVIIQPPREKRARSCGLPAQAEHRGKVRCKRHLLESKKKTGEIPNVFRGLE